MSMRVEKFGALFAAVCFPPAFIHRPILRVSFAAERHSQVPILADVRGMLRDGRGEFLIFLRLASPRFRRLLWPSGFWGVGAVPASHAYGYGPGGAQVFSFQCFSFPGHIFCVLLSFGVFVSCFCMRCVHATKTL